jgi:membrane protease YdiL (CAAX protease family)
MTSKGDAGLRFWAEHGTFAALAIALTLASGPILIGSIAAIFGDLANAPAALLQNLALISPVFPLVLGIIAWLRFRAAKVSLRTVMVADGAAVGRDLRLGLMAGLASLALVFGSLSLVGGWTALPPFAQMPWQHHLFFATIGAIIPAFCEELYFRALLLNRHPTRAQPFVLLTSAAAFAAWHIASPAYLPHTFALGLVWGWLYLRTGRLMAPFVAHLTGNCGFGLLLLAGFLPG